jgi:UDP-3-O-[3-hydroxymyristoyl] glucosamine N-acyltransferase
LPEPKAIHELVSRFGGESDDGVHDYRVERVVSPAALGNAGDLVLLLAPKQASVPLPPSAVCLCAADIADRVPGGRRWVHTHALWVVSELLSELTEHSVFRAEPRAVYLEAGAEIAEGVVIEPGAVVHRAVRIGQGSRIGANAVIYSGVEIGRRVSIGASAVIGRQGFGFTQSPDGKRVRIPQLGGVIIEDDVEVGPLCTVDSGTLGPTRLCEGVKLDAQIHVAHNVQIGAHTVVAAQSGFAGSVVVDQDVLIGGQSGVADHVRIGRGARVAAKSGVVGDIPAGRTVAGFPAVSKVRWLRAMAALMKSGKRRHPR